MNNKRAIGITENKSKPDGKSIMEGNVSPITQSLIAQLEE